MRGRRAERVESSKQKKEDEESEKNEGTKGRKQKRTRRVTRDSKNLFGEGRVSRLQEIPNTCCSTAESSAELHNKSPECSECVITSGSE